jgi:hypothetical protein
MKGILKMEMRCIKEKCNRPFFIVECLDGRKKEEIKNVLVRSYLFLVEAINNCNHGIEKAKKGKIYIGQTEVKLKGKPFVIGVDTFDGDDWLVGYFETNNEAIENARNRGKEMLKMHAYDKNGNHIGEGGTF